MKVFISWSGNLSNRLAEAFTTWLPGTLQTVRPYFTPSDIEKGQRWNTEIVKELEASEVGVLFITRENIDSAWLMYEAGALSKSLEKSRVCPITFGIAPADLPSPLRQFQATEYKEEDFKKLLKTINTATGDNRLPDATLNEVFELWWPRLKEKIDGILAEEDRSGEDEPIRQDREILEEILELSRLNVRRGGRADTLSAGAVSDIISLMFAARNAIQGATQPEEALHALDNMRHPLEYIARRSGFREELVQRVEEMKTLSFDYESPELEDDAPF